MRRRLIASLCLLLPAPALADEVVLKNGARLSCEVIEETRSHVKVRLPHGTMTLSRAKVVRIVREQRGKYLRREGAGALKAGSTKSAVEMYEKALALDPEDAIARRDLVKAILAHAEALFQESRFDAAAAALRRLGELQPGHAGARDLAVRLAQEVREVNELFEGAHAALRGGNFGAALAQLDRWRLRRPADDPHARTALKDAHFAAGVGAITEGALRPALDHFRAAAAYGGGDRIDEVLYLLAPVAVLEALKEGDTRAARTHLDRIRTTYPDPAVPVYLQAVIHHVVGEVESAVKAYAESARLAEGGGRPARGLDYQLVRLHAAATMRAAIARPPQEGVERWRELFLAPLQKEQGKHFTVYAPTDKLARRVAERADAAYERIARELLRRIPDASRAEIVVHPARQVYLAADPSPPGTESSTVTVPRARTGAICYETLDEKGEPIVRVELAADDAGLLETTLPHELVHVVQRRGLGVFRRGAWLDEGLAMLFESSQNQANRRALWRTTRQNRIPLPELLALQSAPPDRFAIFYVQSFALTEFLHGLGDETDWRRFLDVFARKTFEDAIEAVYGVKSIGELEREFLKKS